jgi:hypothetical protein
MKGIFVLLFCTTFSACNRNDDFNIRIDSPQNKSSLSVSQPVPVKVSLSTKNGLDVFHLRVVDVNNNNVVFDWQHVLMGENSFQTDTAINIQQKGSYKTTIEVIDKKPLRLKAESDFLIR